jgi:hypothetical protein
MKRFLISAVATATALTVAFPVAAAPVSAPFEVSVALTTKCESTTVGTQTLNFAYESFQVNAAAPTSGLTFTFKCTRGIPAPTVAFDVSGLLKTSSNAGLTATGEGVVAGLRYTLTAAANSSTDLGTAADATQTGSAKLLSYAVSGAIPGGQAGTCGTGPGGVCNDTQNRTLIVAY